MDELKRLLVEDSDVEQQHTETQFSHHDTLLLATRVSVIPVCVPFDGVTIQSLEKVINYDLFLLHVQPTIVLIKVLEIYKKKIENSKVDNKIRFLQIGQKEIFEATSGLAKTRVEVY